MLAGVATGLVLHFARDIAEGYPGVRVFWPLQDTSWMVSYRWFLGMIVVFTAARLVLVGTGFPHARIPVFRSHPHPVHDDDVISVAGLRASAGSGSSQPGRERASHRADR